MAAAGLDSAVAFTKLGVSLGADEGVGDLNEERLEERVGAGNASRFHLAA